MFAATTWLNEFVVSKTMSRSISFFNSEKADNDKVDHDNNDDNDDDSHDNNYNDDGAVNTYDEFSMFGVELSSEEIIAKCTIDIHWYYEFF